MPGFMVKNRKIVVEQQIYTYSVEEGPEGIDLLIYQDKQPQLRLRQSWTESWGIDFYRPKVVAAVIQHYQQWDFPDGPQLLSRQRELFLKLADLCFSPDDPAEKELFIQRCLGTENH